MTEVFRIVGPWLQLLIFFDAEINVAVRRFPFCIHFFGHLFKVQDRIIVFFLQFIQIPERFYGLFFDLAVFVTVSVNY